MKHLQRHLLVLLLALLPGVASFAGEAADSLYIFRFVQGKDAFYAPWRDNGAQLEALLTLLRAHREAILSGSTRCAWMDIAPDRLRTKRIGAWLPCAATG
nr:hypothetical protein [Bacteroides intestinalis]